MDEAGTGPTIEERERRSAVQARVLVELARSKALGGADLDAALREITEADARLLGVERVGVWLYNPERSQIRCVDLYELGPDRHSGGQQLEAAAYPAYFRALEEERTIAAHDAHKDPRTHEFSASYLTPLGISSMLDAPIRLGGESVGVVCHEHVGSPRHWGSEEQTFAGSIADMVSLAIEASERRQAEEALRRSEEQLRQAHKMEALGRLAGGVAHDFNNLLSGILGYCSVLMLELPADSPARPHVAAMQALGKQASSLTQQLLAFSRRQRLRPAPIDLGEVLQDMEPVLRRLLDEGHKLELLRPAVGGWVLADRSQIEQVVLNLALNGRDAMPQGGRLSLEVQDPAPAERERPPDARPGEYVLLQVSDTGVGLDPKARAHLFEPFFTTKPPGEGTGLGLATVDGIVRQSGGFITVYSEAGRGTTFRVFLPRLELPS